MKPNVSYKVRISIAFLGYLKNNSYFGTVLSSINMKKGGPRTSLFELCKRLQWPMPTFKSAEDKSRFFPKSLLINQSCYSFVILLRSYSPICVYFQLSLIWTPKKIIYYLLIYLFVDDFGKFLCERTNWDLLIDGKSLEKCFMNINFFQINKKEKRKEIYITC